MSYAIVCWEVSTGDPTRATRITQAAELAIAGFNPARLLVGSFVVDTENQNVENMRRALDGVAAGFPQEFFYTAADHPEADVQGIYPPFAELARAHAITEEPRNPLPRPIPALAPGIAAGGAAVGAGRGRRRRGGAPAIAGAVGRSGRAGGRKASRKPRGKTGSRGGGR
jgi:hypothetical protein